MSKLPTLSLKELAEKVKSEQGQMIPIEVRFYATKQYEYTNRLFCFKIKRIGDAQNLLFKFLTNQNYIKAVFINFEDSKTKEKLSIQQNLLPSVYAALDARNISYLKNPGSF